MAYESRTARRTATAVAAIVLLAGLAACGKKHDATQTAARVDGAEITVHQINYRLQKMRGLRTDQLDVASRQVLEQLIDEQLAVRTAEHEKLDKAPAAVQALDAARRDVLARAYVEQAALGVPTPTEDVLHRYYDDNPALFANRRVYTIQEFVAQVAPDKVPALQAIVAGGKPVDDVVAWLKETNSPFKDQQSTRAAEQVPLGSLKALASVSDGHGLMAARGAQVRVVYVLSSVSQPVSYERAKPAITQYLMTETRRQATESNLAALKTAAKIDYAPAYASLAASSPALTTKDIAANAPSQADSGARVSLPGVERASGVQVSLPTTANSGVQVTLPATNTGGVRVSLPRQAASGVEVRLPPQGGAGK